MAAAIGAPRITHDFWVVEAVALPDTATACMLCFSACVSACVQATLHAAAFTHLSKTLEEAHGILMP
jgi:heme/copper-type cytochrome/quinol oxidase subunit 4